MDGPRQEDAPVFGRADASGQASRRAVARRLRRGKHTAPKRAEEKPLLFTVLTVASLVTLVCLLLAVVGRLTAREAFRRLQAADRAEVMADGITVDGVPLGGSSREKARALLFTPRGTEALSFQYRIHAGDQTAVMTAADLPVGTNMETVLDQAWSLSRRLRLGKGETADSPFAARARLRAALIRDGSELSSMTGYELTDIDRYAAALARQVDREPVDAALVSVDFSRRDFTFSDDIPGVTLDQAALAAEITRRLSAGETDAEFEAPLSSVPAAVPRLRLKNTFGCLEVRNFDTDTPGGDGQVLAAVQALNGTIIPGGETVSLRGLLDGAVDSYESANAGRFAAALFDAGVCAGMRLTERHAIESAAPEKRGLEAALDAENDLRLQNTARTPLCLLCYYTPYNGRGTRGSVTMEVYGIMRQGGETAELAAEVMETLPAGAPEYRTNSGLEPGTTLIRREAADGAKVNTVLLKKINGRVYSRDIVCAAVYPPVNRLLETGPKE